MLRPPQDEAIHDLEEVLEGCREAFQEVDDALSKSMRVGADGKTTISRTEKLKWPLRSSKLEVLRANLEKLKSTLLLMLSVLTYGAKASHQAAVAVNMKVNIALTLDRLQIESLMEAKNGAEERYEELRKRFDELEVKAGKKAREIDDIEATVEGASANIATALPGADTTQNEITATEFTEPSDNLAIALQRCASTVSILALCIDASAEQWRTTRIFQPHAIHISLHETIEAIHHLKTEEAASRGSSKQKPSKSRLSSSHPAQSRETSQRNRETVQGPSDPTIDWTRWKSPDWTRTMSHDGHSGHGDDYEWELHRLRPFSSETLGSPSTTHEAKIELPTPRNTTSRDSELHETGYQFAVPPAKDLLPKATGGEQELLADDDGMELDLGAEEEPETVEFEEEAEAEEEEEDAAEEDLEPEDAVEHLLQRWTGLVGV